MIVYRKREVAVLLVVFYFLFGFSSVLEVVILLWFIRRVHNRGDVIVDVTELLEGGEK